MFRVSIVACLVALALANQPIKSSEEIQSFKEFLQTVSKVSDVTLEKRMQENPKALPWENSGKFQGDMLLDDFQIEDLTKEFAEPNKMAYIWPNTKWPNNLIFYAFGNGEFTQAQQNAILDAMAEIERYTCIRFRPRSNEFNYVLLTGRADGCYANVGYWATRGVHTLNLARANPGVGCFIRTTIIHEWMHIIGFMHMQSTYNRDDWVRIMWENVWPGMEHNFEKYGTNVVSNLNLQYDYGSCMHYGGYGFSTNGRPTMVALHDHLGVMGQQWWVSSLDWLRINRHYNCPGAWSKTAEEEVAQDFAKLNIVNEVPSDQ